MSDTGWRIAINTGGGDALTFGYDSAVSFATECIDRLHVTAQARRRLIVVEVMGRNAGSP